MNPIRVVLAVCAFALAMGVSIAPVPQAASPSKPEAVRVDEFSAAKRKYPRRVVRHPEAPRYSAYQRGSDPSLGPDGRPYPVPEYLRRQCYIDEGYGRFSACPNR
jgi:hypothetical protein